MEQSSDVELAAIDEAFRQQIRAWLAEHLVGEFKAVGGVGGPADDEAWDVRLAWERELAAARWLNISWPEEYGGRGGTPRQELLFHIEHAAADAPYWVGVQGRDLFGPTLLEFGTDEQRKRFLPAIANVEELWGQGFSEPGAGSDLAGLATRVARHGDAWHARGQKVWTSRGAYSQWGLLLARHDPTVRKHEGITAFGVDMRGEGSPVIRTGSTSGRSATSPAAWSSARSSSTRPVPQPTSWSATSTAGGRW